MLFQLLLWNVKNWLKVLSWSPRNWPAISRWRYFGRYFRFLQPVDDDTCFLLFICRQVNLLSTQGLAHCFCWHISLMWLWDYVHLISFLVTCKNSKILSWSSRYTIFVVKTFPMGFLPSQSYHLPLNPCLSIWF